MKRKETNQTLCKLDETTRTHISCKLSFSIFTVARERVRVLLFDLALSWARFIFIKYTFRILHFYFLPFGIYMQNIQRINKKNMIIHRIL